MKLAPIAEISQIRVLDRGVPNKERIAIEFALDTELAALCLVCGTKNAGGFIPSRNHFYLLPDEMVTAGTWVIVFTGIGERRWTVLQNSGRPALVLHWGRSQTLFAHGQSTAAVFLISGFQAAMSP